MDQESKKIPIQCILGDITKQKVDAMVNAANSRLAGGGGVDGAIHRAAGPTLMEELATRYTKCPTGSAVITGAGNLMAKYVIHAVGPIWQGGHCNEAQLLESAYCRSFELAHTHHCRTIALPAISAGVYGYPIVQAASIAARATETFYLQHQNAFDEIRFILFGKKTYAAFTKAFKTHL